MDSNLGKLWNLLLVAGIALALSAAGCSTTVESQPEAAKAVESGGSLPASVTSFLGPDASKLAPGKEAGAALVWINPNAQWANYTKIESVAFISASADPTNASNSKQSMSL